MEKFRGVDMLVLTEVELFDLQGKAPAAKKVEKPEPKKPEAKPLVEAKPPVEVKAKIVASSEIEAEAESGESPAEVVKDASPAIVGKKKYRRK